MKPFIKQTYLFLFFLSPVIFNQCSQKKENNDNELLLTLLQSGGVAGVSSGPSGSCVLTSEASAKINCLEEHVADEAHLDPFESECTQEGGIYQTSLCADRGYPDCTKGTSPSSLVLAYYECCDEGGCLSETDKKTR